MSIICRPRSKTFLRCFYSLVPSSPETLHIFPENIEKLYYVNLPFQIYAVIIQRHTSHFCTPVRMSYVTVAHGISCDLTYPSFD